MPEPIARNHNDLLGIEIYFEDITSQLTNTEISLSGLSINADAGFDSQKLITIFSDKEIIVNICPIINEMGKIMKTIILMNNYTTKYIL